MIFTVCVPPDAVKFRLVLSTLIVDAPAFHVITQLFCPASPPSPLNKILRTTSTGNGEAGIVSVLTKLYAPFLPGSPVIAVSFTIAVLLTFTTAESPGISRAI
nr:MAG TPA: hypothetical protein [Caudoviricetes sp.]